MRGATTRLRRIGRVVGAGKDTVRETLKTLSKNPQDGSKGLGGGRRSVPRPIRPWCTLATMAARTRSRQGKRQKRKQSKTPQNPARRPLTFRQERLVAALPTAPSIAAAGRAAGYAEATVRDRSWYRMVYEKLRPLALSNLARVGLTPSVAAKKHFDLLNAKKPMMFEGEVVGFFEDNPTQMQALETYYRILGVVGRVAGDAPEELETDQVPQIHFHLSGAAKPKGDGKADGRFRVMLEK